MQKKLLFCVLLLASCASPNQPTTNISLQPYLTNTPQNTNTPNVLIVETTPIPTNTPHIYIVEQGDTFSEVAEKFKVSISDLRAANPDVSPNAMPVGQSLIIPDPSAIFAAASTPTPLPVPITQTVCHADNSSGLHCFALIQNNSANMLENVSVKFNLLDEANNVIASDEAFTILDIIPANSSLPVYVYFSNVNQKVNPQVQLLSAYQGNVSNYVSATINNSVTEIDGNFANVNGQYILSASANQVWIVAVAYDKNGTVNGVKRWESRAATQAGVLTQFRFSVSSVGADIEALEFFIQAK
ncbi:MAG: peptidoglycan-binding LysM [Chloroflexi bacterium OLB14]|nr:MAG: peptidoglycan-binding LysM [Chloroflexi bacterium OLB14]